MAPSRRPLPRPPGQDAAHLEAMWYEHEERMRPSYIQMPGRDADSRAGGVQSISGQNLALSRFDSPSQDVQHAFPSRNASRTVQTTPSRIRPTSMQVGGDGHEEARRTQKASIFMHKGFLDILNLVNSPSGRPATSTIRNTFSKATGRLRKVSNANAIRNDAFFDGPSPQLVSSPTPKGSPASAGQATFSQAQTSTDTAYSLPQQGLVPGPRAEKKRISTYMIGAPHPESFVHAAHASDAEQAESMLRKWGVEGQGQLAGPQWTNRCQEALQIQAERNQLDPMTQNQETHQQSTLRGFSHHKEGLQNMQNVATLKSKKLTEKHEDEGTHSISNRDTSSKANQPLVGSTSGCSTQPMLSKLAPPPPPAGPRPPLEVRSNTYGTVKLLAESNNRQNVALDYMQYKPEKDWTGTTRIVEGLPGCNETLKSGSSPFSKDTVRQTPAGEEQKADQVTRNLAGEEMADSLARRAGAALRPSLTTVEKSVAAKIYFENLYFSILKKPQARDTRRAGLEAELANLQISDSVKNAIRSSWAANETDYLREMRSRVSANAFVKLKTIGHGAFGVVALVREQGSGEVYAMKQLRKADMLRKGQEGHIRAERDLMTSASASADAKWIVKLVYSFQDVDHLFLIMEFMGGGDLLNLLIERDIFEEDMSRFYAAEMILAIHEAHKFGYIHRDIKPDNFLFTSAGHIKLADFGLCQSFHWAHDGAYYEQQRKQLLRKHGIDLEDAQRSRQGSMLHRNAPAGSRANVGGNLTEKELDKVMSDRNKDGTPLTHVLTWREKNKKKLAYSVVGTNNYMAPEVLRGLGYDQSCDWWSFGVIVFEMLYGYPPFVSKSRHMTRQKILNWKQTLKFPPKPKVSKDAQDFIRSLICEKEDRLGSIASASVSRPNSLIQGSRQRSGFSSRNSGDLSRPAATGLADGVEDIMAHKWFRGIDWATIHKKSAPFVPDLSHAADTKHFEDDIKDEPLPAPGAAEAAKNGLPPPVEQLRDPMLRDKEHGEALLEMRKQLAFKGYTFKSPKVFDPRTQLTESKIRSAENTMPGQQKGDVQPETSPSKPNPPPTESRLRSMSM